MTYTMAQIKGIITQVATADGISPALAIATAQQESGLNPNAVGDQGTSFGLYQLHIGGELGNLPGTLAQQEAAAQNPLQNAEVALNQFAVTQKATGLSGGALAAAAQRPANPSAYASAVNALLGSSGGGTGPPQAQAISGQLGGPGGNAATGAQTAGTPSTAGMSWAYQLQNILNPPSSGVLGTASTVGEWAARLGLVAVGLILFLAGLAIIGVSSLLPRMASRVPAVAAVKRAVA